MILGDFDDTAGEATLDHLFRRAGVRSPDAVALIDPPNKTSFAGGAPLRLTYAQADRLISAFAAHLRALGLHADAVVALQLPNTVESVIALLGVLRAGMIAAPLPLLWRQQEVIAALRGIGPKAIVTGNAELARGAALAAVELFPVRHVCAFGEDLPDGVMPLNDIFVAGALEGVHAAARAGAAAAHVALITFDVTAAGIVPVARNHMQLMAGGLGVFLESALAQEAAVLSAIPAASFAGVSLTLLPWLLAGGTLALHHGGDPQVLGAQCRDLAAPTLVVPGPTLTPLAEADCLADNIKTIAALWRAPERLAVANTWQGDATLVDVASFGEIGLVGSRRGRDGMPAPLPLGRVEAPRGATGAVAVVETARTRHGTLALRGPMVPTHAFPPGGTNDPDSFHDTGFACHSASGGLIVTGAPGDIETIGGYRFHRPTVENELAAIDPAATIMSVPDGMLGQRLAGGARDRQALIAALQDRGANPLLVNAFRARRHPAAA